MPDSFHFPACPPLRVPAQRPCSPRRMPSPSRLADCQRTSRRTDGCSSRGGGGRSTTPVATAAGAATRTAIVAAAQAALAGQGPIGSCSAADGSCVAASPGFVDHSRHLRLGLDPRSGGGGESLALRHPAPLSLSSSHLFRFASVASQTWKAGRNVSSRWPAFWTQKSSLEARGAGRCRFPSRASRV